MGSGRKSEDKKKQGIVLAPIKPKMLIKKLSMKIF